jgi:hypothetical protein
MLVLGINPRESLRHWSRWNKVQHLFSFGSLIDFYWLLTVPSFLTPKSKRCMPQNSMSYSPPNTTWCIPPAYSISMTTGISCKWLSKVLPVHSNVSNDYSKSWNPNYLPFVQNLAKLSVVHVIHMLLIVWLFFTIILQWQEWPLSYVTRFCIFCWHAIHSSMVCSPTAWKGSRWLMPMAGWGAYAPQYVAILICRIGSLGECLGISEELFE